MTPLRQRMIHELELHRKSRHTIEAYVTAVAQLARHYGRSPEAISVEEIRDFLHHLITVQKAAFSTCNLKLAGIQFFYHHVLGQEQFSLRVPAKRSGRLPEPLSRNEIAKLFEVTSNLKHRTLLMTVYGGGLRVSEVVHLRPRDIHSDRMLIRVNQGKGRKDRYTLLSARLLEELRAYWRQYRPQQEWLFPGGNGNGPLSMRPAGPPRAAPPAVVLPRNRCAIGDMSVEQDHGRLAGAQGRLVHVRLDLALTDGLIDMACRARRLGVSHPRQCRADRTARHDLRELLPVQAMCRMYFHNCLFRNMGSWGGSLSHHYKGMSSYNARHASGRSAERPLHNASSIAVRRRDLSRDSVPAKGR